jgi:hypothetical protein
MQPLPETSTFALALAITVSLVLQSSAISQSDYLHRGGLRLHFRGLVDHVDWSIIRAALFG